MNAEANTPGNYDKGFRERSTLMMPDYYLSELLFKAQIHSLESVY